ncbi:growth hormone secretagogue receptor type 1-like [Mizuhopecten yessoensis]|uniref:growth hormone secretagogue receptor type 1-like n=1 Tax=Mizuhopecten yessoensis TaxID=6573 RepID=UPI000B45740C|nr:growth hormone secretagogue receptor type 1-like [Mizuhopecten yessoensis]
MAVNQSNISAPLRYDRVEDTMGYILAMELITWGFPVIVCIGTFGNVLSFIIMMRREMRQTPTFFYLAALAVADTVVLYLSALKTWIRLITGFELLHISNASCKTFIFTIQFSLHFSAWLIVAVTIERFLAVWFPLRANRMCSLSRAKFVTFMIALTFALVNVYLFWTAELLTDPSRPEGSQDICAAYAYKNFVCNVFPWVNLLLYSFLPFVILLVFNSLIVVSLVRNKGIFSNMTKDDRVARYRHRRLAITLLVISFVWIVTTLPRSVYGLVKGKPGSLDELGYQVLGKVICFVLMYINHSINFFLYCLTGQRFRMEFVKFMCQWKQSKSPPKARLTFKSSVSVGSGQDTSTSLPLMVTPSRETANFD